MGFSNSVATVDILQKKYGVANYNQFQALRQRFWSFITYPEAGQTTNTFFGNALGTNGQTLEQTNMPKANSFGQNHFLLQSISCVFKIKTWALDAFDGTDTSSLMADLISGMFQGGYLEFGVNQKPYIQVPKPFMYCPPADGEIMIKSAGVSLLTLTEATPNTLLKFVTATPCITQVNRKDEVYMVDDPVFIPAEQNFSCSINYPSGIIPVVGTGVTDDTTNPLQIGVILDGTLFRPLS